MVGPIVSRMEGRSENPNRLETHTCQQKDTERQIKYKHTNIHLSQPPMLRQKKMVQLNKAIYSKLLLSQISRDKPFLSVIGGFLLLPI